MQIPGDTSATSVLDDEESDRACTLSSEIWSPATIEQIAELAQSLQPPFTAVISPKSFLRSLSGGWLPRTVVVRRGPEIVGLVLAKEKLIAGLPMGILYADGSLGNVVFAQNHNQEAVLKAALAKLLASPRVKALRFVFPPEGFEMRAAREAGLSMRWTCYEAPLFWNHARLQLPSTYDIFLSSLGSRTRRNFRYYRRKFEAEGHEYVPELSDSAMREAAVHLRRKCRIQSSSRDVHRKLEWVAGEDRPFCCGLRSKDGEWLSLAAGFYSPTGVTMLLQQNNDLDFESNSLSLVLRSYLIESLILNHFKELIFWGGPGGALLRYVDFAPGTTLFLDSPGTGWKAVRALVRAIAPMFPQRVRQSFGWIVPR